MHIFSEKMHFELRLGLASPDLESFLALARTRSTQVQPPSSRLRERAGDLRAGLGNGVGF